MNKWEGIGRLTRDPEVRYTQGSNPMAIARYTLAVDRRIKKENEQSADFIPCIAFGKSAEFVEKYLKKGTKMAVVGRIQTGSYTNQNGQKVYTTEIIVEEQEFAESKNASSGGQNQAPQQSQKTQDDGLDGFMNIPDGIDEGELPFA